MFAIFFSAGAADLYGRIYIFLLPRRVATGFRRRELFGRPNLRGAVPEEQKFVALEQRDQHTWTCALPGGKHFLEELSKLAGSCFSSGNDIVMR